MDDRTETPGLTRRRALGVAGIGIAVPALAACGDDNGDPVGVDPDGLSQGGNQAPGPGSADGIVDAADVPVGSGVIVAEERVVVTQPTAGDFRAWSAVCTHDGCLVSRMDGAEIVCTCHFSRYSITDGSVVGGPAPAPLDEVSISVEDGRVVRG
ncbi:Rieske (2Fe-2S) protein [Nocardioides limicola]|uniref:Rieske (2Fe-2S) protein n=1 Tax=Nocardioides limicola TaxID=2803368 RepID=UPI00193B8030|nr:Rieske (2Fe-2S) protein [Nocardioides sp. DJM-14]